MIFSIVITSRVPDPGAFILRYDVVKSLPSGSVWCIAIIHSGARCVDSYEQLPFLSFSLHKSFSLAS